MGLEGFMVFSSLGQNPSSWEAFAFVDSLPISSDEQKSSSSSHNWASSRSLASWFVFLHLMSRAFGRSFFTSLTRFIFLDYGDVDHFCFDQSATIFYDPPLWIDIQLWDLLPVVVAPVWVSNHWSAFEKKNYSWTQSLGGKDSIPYQEGPFIFAQNGYLRIKLRLFLVLAKTLVLWYHRLRDMWLSCQLYFQF